MKPSTKPCIQCILGLRHYTVIISTQQQNVIKVDNQEGKKQVTNHLNYSPTLTTESTSSINMDNLTVLISFTSSSKWLIFLNYTAISHTITMKSLQVGQAQEDSRSHTDGSDKVSDKTIVIPNKLTTIADSFKGEHSWYTCNNFFYRLDTSKFCSNSIYMF